MRRDSVASLRVRHLDDGWGLPGVRVKGGKTQDIPLPSAVMAVLKLCIQTRPRDGRPGE
jgi:integrase